MKTVIIGGVAAGASAAARLRRLDEFMEIVLLERGEYLSYANGGLPYHLGGVIPERDSLFVMPEKKFRAWFNVDVRARNEAVAIDRARKVVRVRRADGSEYEESYDKLLLATGSRPAAPELPGSDDPRIHSLWTIPDMDALGELVKEGARRALVVGGGFIGLETAENLRKRGLEVTIVQHSGHVLPSIDREMAWLLGAELAADGVDVRLNAELTGFRKDGESLVAQLQDGTELAADLVVMSVGVRPNSELAAAAGLELGARGHIVVDEHLRTSEPEVFGAENRDPARGPGQQTGADRRRQHRRERARLPRQLGRVGHQGREFDRGGGGVDRIAAQVARGQVSQDLHASGLERLVLSGRGAVALETALRL